MRDSRGLTINQFLDRFLIQVAALDRPPREQHLAQVIREAALEPGFNRYAGSPPWAASKRYPGRGRVSGILKHISYRLFSRCKCHSCGSVATNHPAR